MPKLLFREGKSLLGLWAALGVLSSELPYCASAHAMMGEITGALTDETPGETTATQVSDSAEEVADDAPAASEPDIHRSTKQLFWLVRTSQCKTSVTGDLFSCRAPEIQLSEVSRSLPPLPYETKIVIRASSRCRGSIDSTVGSLQIRLGKFTELQTDSDFLRHEPLNFSQSQMVILNQPLAYPFKNLTIKSLTSEIFTQARFPQGCEVSVEIEFNRIALKTRSDAETYLKRLKDQVQLMKTLHSSLLDLQEARSKQRATQGLLGNLQDVFVHAKTRIFRIQKDWESLQRITRALEISVSKNHALAADPQLQALTTGMANFSCLMNQAIDRGPGGLLDLMSQIRQDDVTEFEQFLDLMNATI